MSDSTITSTLTPSGEDDPFFVLRDCRELFQEKLVDIARHTGISSPSVIKAFSKEIGEAYDDLASATRHDGFEQTAGLTASRISLVGNDDLELEIRINDIANHLRDNERIEHWRVQSRFMTLLHRPLMNVDNSPVGLEPIRRGLWVLCKEGGQSIDKTFSLLDRLEEQLQLCLPDVYKELNDILRRNNVAPTAPKIVQREDTGPTSSGQSPPGSANQNTAGYSGASAVPAGHNPLAALQQTLQKQSTANNLFPPEAMIGTPAGNNFTLDATAAVMLNQLMERLRVLELQQLTGLASLALDGKSKEQPLHALKSKDFDLPLGTPAAVALDTLSLIFEAIFASPDLPEIIKSAIGRLQIPLLRLSMHDATFFSDTQHPARRLINRMAQASNGLNAESGRDHPQCAKLVKLAETARTTLDSSDADLAPLLDELDKLITERDERARTAAEPYIELVKNHEAMEVAQSEAQYWLKQALENSTEPEIKRFLADHWVRVMQNAFLIGGASSERAKEYDLTVKELLWSVQPKQTPDERKKLLGLIPNLLKKINAGLDSVGISTEERTPFFDACFKLQTASLRSRPEDAGTLATTAAETAPASAEPHKPSSDPEVRILENKGKLVQYLGQPTGKYATLRQENNAWKEGDWVAFVLPDGEHLCGRLSWQGAPFGTMVLFNKDWGYAVALAPRQLEQQLRSGQARVVSKSSLFDEAAKNALKQISPH